MKIVQATPYLAAQQGGPSVVVPLLARELHTQRASVQIVTQVRPGESAAEVQGVPCHYALTRDRSGFGYSSALKKLMRQNMASSDVLHTHGLWMYINRVSATTAGALRKPHVITPHGMLEPWALANSAWKKSLMRRLFEDKSLRNAACIHALCRPEARNIRSLGFKTPIAVIPNGIDLQEYEELPQREAFVEKWPHLKHCKIILFLARIHPKKGLLHLIEAWSRLAAQFPEWHLVIAGPDEVGHQIVLQQAVESYGLTRQMTFVGMLAGADKLTALSAADLFVLPSFSEGFSVAVLEAMASKLTVLLTPQCNFPEASVAGAGIEVNPDAASTQAGLHRLLALSDEQRKAMGLKGYEIVSQNYTWKRIAKQMIEVYDWCLGGGSPPPFVEVI